ncbi:MAG: LLM class flavin-dependent oxidoreductase [Rhizobiaceae bacterium]|nr:LLM class flavin-dependent oxidoreductase [Rhizobiaceae bacterium]
MEFNHFLSAYYPDTSYGGDRLFADMLDQARQADRLGYASVSIPEHHLINILLTPAPLQMAVKVAAETENLDIMTSVVQLPLHDMRTYAGEVVMTDILTDQRLMLGVGRGAFAVEMERMGAPIEQSREKFDESLNVLQALLERENVSWRGDYYNFDELTVMPRPVRKVPIMMAALAPPAIYHSTLRSFHIQTTPLMSSNEKMLEQVGAFHKAKDELGTAGEELTLSLSRVCWLAKNEQDKWQKVAQAHDYYALFDNVFTGPGQVHSGAIAPLPRQQTMEELETNLLICTRDEFVDQLGIYAEAGVDQIILSQNIGPANQETLDNMQAIAEEVMPHFTNRTHGEAA